MDQNGNFDTIFRYGNYINEDLSIGFIHWIIYIIGNYINEEIIYGMMGYPRFFQNRQTTDVSG